MAVLAVSENSLRMGLQLLEHSAVSAIHKLPHRSLGSPGRSGSFFRFGIRPANQRGHLWQLKHPPIGRRTLTRASRCPLKDQCRFLPLQPPWHRSQTGWPALRHSVGKPGKVCFAALIQCRPCS